MNGHVSRTLVLYAIALTMIFGSLPPSGAQENDYEPLSSEPENLYAFNNFLYFTAEDGVHGRELWRVSVPDGVPEFIADVTRGPRGSKIDRFHAFNGKLYFRVLNPSHGGEFWCSDGEPEGRTERIKRFASADPSSGFDAVLGDLGHTMLLGVGIHTSSKAVWRSDGTPEGTVYMGKETVSGLSSISGDGVSWDGHLLLSASGRNGANSVTGLWRSDGTWEGSECLKVFDGEPGAFCVLEGVGVLFSGKTEGIGNELWFTKGTPETTILLRDIWDGPESSDPSEFGAFGAAERSGPPVAYFRANHPERGLELWRTDGTPEGTQLVEDIIPGVAGSHPYKMTPIRKSIYFNARTESEGNELWRLWARDPDAKCRRLTDINPGPLSSSPYAFCNVGAWGVLIFSAEGENGEELWAVSDEGTRVELVKDIFEGPGDSFPAYTTFVNGYVVCSATHPVYGRELWMVSPSREARLLCDLYSDRAENPSSSPSSLTPLGDKLLFVADDIEHGRELWVTTENGSTTEMVKDIYTGRIGSTPHHLTVVGDVIYFAAETPEEGTELWVSDGTPEGTALTRDINGGKESSGPKHMIELNGILLFSAYWPLDGEELWAVHPNRKPDIVLDIHGGPESSFPKNFVVWNNMAYFQAHDGVHGEELWRTDGTAEGTTMVKDVIYEPYERLSVYQARPQGDYLYLSAADPRNGHELWVLDTSGNPPRLVEDVAKATSLRILRSQP